MPTPEEQDLQYRIALDAQNAILELRQLAQLATDFDTRITAAANKAMMFGEKWGMSGNAAVGLFKQVDSSINGTLQKSVVFGQVGPQAWNDVGAAVRRAENDMNAFEHGIDFVRVALGTLSAMLVFQVMQAFITTFTTAISLVKELEVSFYNLQNAERIMSEGGIEVTFKDLETIVDRISVKFKGMFSKVEIRDVVADIAIATKDLGFSVQQIEMLTQAIAAVQLRNPDLTFKEAEQHAITALLSGRTQALQNMGISANEATVKEKALEMGLIKTGDALTPQTKALAILQIMYDATSKEASNLSERQQTLAGTSQTLSASWQDFLTGAGQFIAPFLEGLQSLASDILRWFTASIPNALNGLARSMAFAGATLLTLREIVKGNISSVEDLTTTWQKFFDTGEKNLRQKLDFGGITTDMDTATGAAKNLADAIDALTSKDLDSLINSVSNFADRMDKLNTKFSTDIRQGWEDYYTKLKRSQEDYQINVSETIQQYNDKRKSIEQSYRNNEITAEARYQEDLRKLREKYLFDLEDALRARDARQVLRLMAQYKMDKENTTKQFKLQQDERRRQYEQELADNKKQEQEKLAQMAAAQKLKEQRMKEDWDTERTRKLQQYQQDLADLQKSWDDRLREEANKLKEQYGLNDSQTDQIYQLLKSYYGPQGYLDGLYDYSYSSLLSKSQALLQALNTMIQQFNNTVSNIGMPALSPNWVPPTTGSFKGKGGKTMKASGGIDIVDSATQTSYGATYGEAGKEAHIFIPLGNSNSIPELGSILGGDKSGKIGIEVLLSPDLEARIVENTMNKTADVITRVQRSK